MNSQYIKQAMRTDLQEDQYAKVWDRTENIRMLRLLHSTIGISTEAGELLDTTKKAIFYGKQLDIPNVKEEVGDIFWYIAMICDEFNFDIQEILDKNINKLRARYPEKFTEFDALNRQLDKERNILEK